jgi:hypothetical protein
MLSIYNNYTSSKKLLRDPVYKLTTHKGTAAIPA